MNGGKQEKGSTVWQGSTFDCEHGQIILRFYMHNSWSSNRKAATTSWSVNVTMINDSNQYTSQLAIIVKPEMNGEYIRCFHDNGTDAYLVGSSVLNVRTAINCMHTSISDPGYLSMNSTSIYIGSLTGSYMSSKIIKIRSPDYIYTIADFYLFTLGSGVSKLTILIISGVFVFLCLLLLLATVPLVLLGFHKKLWSIPM